MSDIIKIFFMNFINDLDNLLIITGVIRKYGYTVKTLFSYLVICLTLSRTLYVLIIHSLVTFPGLRFIAGLIILVMAVKLAWSIEKDSSMRAIPSISVSKMILIVLATDFPVCLDSVMITNELSSNSFYIAIGIFFSLSTIFTIYNSFSEILSNTSWIQVIASGLIAHIAILSIIKDPITKSSIIFIEELLEIHNSNWMNVFALDAAIIIIIIGVIRRLQNYT